MITDWIILALRMMAPCLLLLFLAISFYHLKKQPDSAVPKDYLQLLNQSQHRFDLEAATSLGRHQDNTYSFANTVISAHHATIIYRDTGWWLTDLSSTNGTTVNETPVQSPTPLRYGDIITLGDIQFRLHPADPSTGDESRKFR